MNFAEQLARRQLRHGTATPTIRHGAGLRHRGRLALLRLWSANERPREPLNFESILIVTYGRSGSTLLQGILNSIEGCYVAGENNNFVLGLYDAYRRLHQTNAAFGGLGADSPTNSWHGASSIRMDLFLANCRRLVRDAILPESVASRTRAFGFKEIRYLDIVELSGYLEFLRAVFPKPCFIFLTRNIEDVLKSGWWSLGEQVELMKKFVRFEQNIRVYAEHHPGTSFSITYEDVVGKTARFREMYRFLGATYNERVINRVLMTPHSCSSQSIISNRVDVEKPRRRPGPRRIPSRRMPKVAAEVILWPCFKKWNKFRRDPKRFFADSRHPAVRALGLVYLWVALGRRQTAHGGLKRNRNRTAGAWIS